MSTAHVVRHVPRNRDPNHRLTADEILVEATGHYVGELGTAAEFRSAKCPPSGFNALRTHWNKNLSRAVRTLMSAIPLLIALAFLIAHRGWIVHRLIHAAHLPWHHP